MKKNLPFIGLVLVLIIILGYLYFSQHSNSLGNVDFNIENTKEISTIELSNKQGTKMTLNKVDGQWLVNNNFQAERNKIQALLEAVNKFKIEILVAQKYRNTAIDNLRNHSIKVKILDAKSNEIKTYHIGNHFPNMGNYMILERNGVVDPNPYLVSIPGFEGDFLYKFLVDSNEWKSTEVFHTEIEKIKSISINYAENEKYSFTLDKEDDLIKISPKVDSFTIKRALNKQNVINFLLEFEDKHYEVLIDNDSLKKSIASKLRYAEINLLKTNNKTQSIILYRMEAAANQPLKDAKGNSLPYNIERFWGYIPNNQSYVVVQYLNFGPILREYSYFFEDKNK